MKFQANLWIGGGLFALAVTAAVLAPVLMIPCWAPI